MSVLAVLTFNSYGQVLSGKVSNNQNTPIEKASIKVLETNKGTASNVDGYYSLSLKTNLKYELEVSAIGYETKIISEVEVSTKGATELHITLVEKLQELDHVVVVARKTTAKMETVASAIRFQKNTNTVASVISAESIKRSPDKNTGEILRRVPGTSLQDGKFIIIRGLADRYNQATLDGILLTSTEPDRKAFSFDAIPAQIIDNIVVNKAFVPEYPGEWAGGLIQINTKEVSSNKFLNIHLGTGINSQTIGKGFYAVAGGKLDGLGMDDGTRSLPASYQTKSKFDALSFAEKTAIGKQLPNVWQPQLTNPSINKNFQLDGGFKTLVAGKKVSAVFNLMYKSGDKYTKMLNRQNNFNEDQSFYALQNYDDNRYTTDVNWGALGNVSIQLNNRNKISLKSIVNINSTNYVVNRNGYDLERGVGGENVKGHEIVFKQNTFFTNQIIGNHSITQNLHLKWRGAFNILDAYSPDQRRILYTQDKGTAQPYKLLIGSTLSQQSGSRIFQSLNDYIYTAGSDIAQTYSWRGLKQIVAIGYSLQIKDRLYDGKFFANYLNTDNAALRALTADKIFAPENFGDGAANSNLFGFDAIKGNNFRYMANTILNAGYVQMDNQLSNDLRVVWGVRIENYDQLIGSVKVNDPRHVRSKVLDFLPGLNATYKLTNKTNIRFTAAQTVIRPELRELSKLNFYDFELNAAIQGNPALERTKVSSVDLRYEVYPRANELFTVGVFYKYFNKPIEQLFYAAGGGASTFTFQNADKASVYGIETEFRKNLDFSDVLKNFTLQANAAYIKSAVKSSSFKVDRPLQGQSPYLFNIGLLYDAAPKGWNATLLYNVIGERIYLVGDIVAGGGEPDIWEASRPLLDFQIAKKIMKNKAELKLNWSDILDKTQYFYQNADHKNAFNKNKDAYRFTRKMGSNVNITFSYSI